MYEITKALHITAVIVWMGAMLVAPIASAAGGTSEIFAARLRLLMNIGLIATWLAGIALASMAGWFQAEWLQAKLVVVIALSAAHGMVAGRLRRGASGGSASNGPRPWFATILMASAVLAIALLVLIKPDF